MLLKLALFAGSQLAIEVGVEFFRPVFASHFKRLVI
jgi:hypothetical protein